MKTISHQNVYAQCGITQAVINDYQVYLKHYSLRNLQPMAFEEFLKNYHN